MIAIINYGSGNPVSVQNMLYRLNQESLIVDDAKALEKSSKIIFPGNGSWDFALNGLHKKGLFKALKEKILFENLPFLGICLGMQLTTSRSEEGKNDGFGWLSGNTIIIDQSANSIKVPNMGWRSIKIKKRSKIFTGFNGDEQFYFSHSFQVICANAGDVLCTIDYGQNITAGIERNNIIGVQFHPEKSGDNGALLLNNFINLY